MNKIRFTSFWKWAKKRVNFNSNTIVFHHIKIACAQVYISTRIILNWNIKEQLWRNMITNVCILCFLFRWSLKFADISLVKVGFGFSFQLYIFVRFENQRIKCHSMSGLPHRGVSKTLFVQCTHCKWRESLLKWSMIHSVLVREELPDINFG